MRANFISPSIRKMSPVVIPEMNQYFLAHLRDGDGFETRRLELQPRSSTWTALGAHVLGLTVAGLSGPECVPPGGVGEAGAGYPPRPRLPCCLFSCLPCFWALP